MHKRTHVTSNYFHFTICNKSFFQQKTLIDYKKLHTEKKFLCQNCEQSFARGDYLKKHMTSCLFKTKVHPKSNSSNSRLISGECETTLSKECDLCSQKFENESALQNT